MIKTPIFVSHYSIGRSILTLELPDDVEEGGPASILKIAQDAKLPEIYLLENNISGFPYAFKNCKKLGIPLRFGEIFKIESKSGEDSFYSKVGIFALNDTGFGELRELHTKVHTEQDGLITFDQLKLGENLGLVIPFYDSFLHVNAFSFANFTYDFASLKPTFFIEENGLPQDLILADIVRNYASNNGCPIVETSTILYENQEDALAYITYRILCGRSSEEGKGGKSNIESPNLNGFGSDKFSWERFKREVL